MTTATAPLLSIAGLSKSFGTNTVLDRVSVDIRAGEVVSVIGASGSGKSTFLRCINLMEMPDAGRITFDGAALDFPLPRRGRVADRTLQALRSRIGMVFQNYNLWPHMTVLQNVTEAPMRVKGVSRAEAVSVAEALLERIGLAEKRDAYPSRLSGGQQQRVAIARALAMQPRLMLFDEVTSALDPELVGEVLGLMASLAADGMTMVLVTHEIAFARDVSTRTLFFDGGRIAEEGPPQDVLRRPSSERLRQFLRRILHEDVTAAAGRAAS